MRISDWSSDVCSSDLVLQARECVEAADGEVEHRLDPFFSESIDDIGRYARIDRGLDVARNALIDEHGDRPRHCTRHGELFFQHVPAGIYEIDEDHIGRSEARRVGKGCVSTCRYRGSPYN